MRGDPEDPLELRLGALVLEWPDLGGAALVSFRERGARETDEEVKR